MLHVTPIPGPRYVGVGFSKTGTSTLGECFRLLGLGPVGSPEKIHETYRDSLSPATDNPRITRFNAFPWRLMVEDIFNYGNYGLAMLIASGYRGLHDRPWSVGNLYQLIDKAYPGSKFVLSWREPDKWWRSVERWLTVVHKNDPEKLPRYLAHLGAEKLDKDLFIAGYLAHNESLRQYFGDRPKDFLEINFEHGEGWGKLCSFFNKPKPGIPFPHANEQKYEEDKA